MCMHVRGWLEMRVSAGCVLNVAGMWYVPAAHLGYFVYLLCIRILRPVICLFAGSAQLKIFSQ